MIKVNLVPADILAKAQQKQRALQAGVAGVAVLMVILGISMLHWLTLKRLDMRLAEGTEKLKKLEVIVKKVEELDKTAKALRARLGVITDLLKGRAVYPYFMADLVRSVPAGVRITQLRTTGGGSSASPVKLNVNAEARTDDDIANWERKMKDSGRFSGIELGPVNARGEAGERLFSFTLTTTYTPEL